MTLTDAPPRPLPRPYLLWLSGFTVARLGDAVLAFALVWAASGRGGTTAGVVLSAGALPRVVLLVVGGAVADRVGARGLLIAGEAALLASTAAVAVALARVGVQTWLLLAASLGLGAVTALCVPASGSMPRRLVTDDQLTRALALRQGTAQAVLLAAAPLGGLLLAGVGLVGVAWAAAGALGVSLAVLVAVREPADVVSDDVGPRPAARADRRRRLELLDGFRVVAATPGLRVALLLAGGGATLLLPVPALLIPLLGRASSWGAGPTGAVAGAAGVGVIAAALLAARSRSPDPRSGASLAASGLVVSAAGAAVLAGAPHLPGNGAVVAALLGAVAFGLGSGTFAARLAPFVLGSAPRTHLARVQALVGLVQSAPVLVTSSVLGVLSERTAPPWALGAVAAGLAVLVLWWRRRTGD